MFSSPHEGSGPGAAQYLFVERDFIRAPNNERGSLMDRLRADIENARRAVAGFAAGLLRDPSKRSAFVKQPQLAVWMLLIGRIQIHTTIDQAGVKIGDQRAAVTQ